MRNLRIFALGLMVLVAALYSGSLMAQEASASTGIKPGGREGHRVGFGFRLGTVGSMRLTEDFDGEETDDFFSMGSSAGFEIFWEYLLPGGIVAPGVGLRMQFHNIDPGNDQRLEVGSEFQLDPRLRIYFANKGVVRPYIQAALGLSLGMPNQNLEDTVKSAIGFNVSGAVGILFVPPSSFVSLYVDAGIEGIMYTVVEDDVLGDMEFKGRMRQMVMNFGILF